MSLQWHELKGEIQSFSTHSFVVQALTKMTVNKKKMQTKIYGLANVWTQITTTLTWLVAHFVHALSLVTHAMSLSVTHVHVGSLYKMSINNSWDTKPQGYLKLGRHVTILGSQCVRYLVYRVFLIIPGYVYDCHSNQKLLKCFFLVLCLWDTQILVRVKISRKDLNNQEVSWYQQEQCMQHGGQKICKEQGWRFIFF